MEDKATEVFEKVYETLAGEEPDYRCLGWFWQAFKNIPAGNNVAHTVSLSRTYGSEDRKKLDSGKRCYEVKATGPMAVFKVESQTPADFKTVRTKTSTSLDYLVDEPVLQSVKDKIEKAIGAQKLARTFFDDNIHSIGSLACDVVSLGALNGSKIPVDISGSKYTLIINNREEPGKKMPRKPTIVLSRTLRKYGNNRLRVSAETLQDLSVTSKPLESQTEMLEELLENI